MKINLNPRSFITRVIPASVIAAAAIALTLVGAGSADATTPSPVTGSTRITDRPDDGNAPTPASPYWADDTFNRVLTITPAAGNPATCSATSLCSFTGGIVDTGTFTTIPGRDAPNQSGATSALTPMESAPAVTGALNGYADFSFTATESPDLTKVPAEVDDQDVVPSGVTLGTDAGTPVWYELAFPSDTKFGGTGIGAWSWTYKTECQSWVDGSSTANNAGNEPADGNITGSCPSIKGFGNVVNRYDNGLDVYQQNGRYNARIVAWPVTATDPGVRFKAVHVGVNVAFEYEPHGAPTGLFVSEAVGSEPSGSQPTGLVLRSGLSAFQQFTVKVASNGSFQLVDVATGDMIQPNGTGVQLTGVSATTAAGSFFKWN